MTDEHAPAAQLSDHALARIVLGLSLVGTVYVVRLLVTTNALDVDPMNLVYGMARFDVAQHAPHPPGYGLYVLALRALHALRGGDPSLAARFATTQWLALAFQLGAIAVTYAVVRRACPERPLRAALAAVVTATQPFLVFHAVDAQTHGAEAFAAGILLAVLLRYVDHPSARLAFVLGASLAFGAALRPSFVVTGVLPIVYVCFRRPRHLVIAGATSIVGALCFLIPTFALSGGYARWQVAHHGLVQGFFVRRWSILSSDGVPELQALQLITTSCWIAILLAPSIALVVSMWVARLRAPSLERPDPRRPLAVLALAAALPSAAFYMLVFCSEPGYLSGVVPFLVVAMVSRVPMSWDAPLPRRVLLPSILVQLLVLFSPNVAPYGLKLPNLGTLVDRDTTVDAWHRELEANLPRDGRFLLVSDYADLTLARQLSMLSARGHMLSFYATPRVLFPVTTAGFLTEDAWIPIPGPAHLVTGPPRIVDVPYAYTAVVVDALSARKVTAAIARRSVCRHLAIPRGRFVVLPASCFPSRTIELDGYGIHFAAPPSR